MYVASVVSERLKSGCCVWDAHEKRKRARAVPTRSLTAQARSGGMDPAWPREMQAQWRRASVSTARGVRARLDGVQCRGANVAGATTTEKKICHAVVTAHAIQAPSENTHTL
jgi:hypothetical protein